MQQREFGARDKPEAAVHVDGSSVRAVDVQDRRLPPREHPVDRVSDECSAQAASLLVRMGANGAHFAEVTDPHPLAGHRYQTALLANPYIGSGLIGAPSEGTLLGGRDQV